MEAGNNKYFELGVFLFNNEEYFLAHECFEKVWIKMNEKDPNKLFYQGLIQCAVGCYHLKNNNLKSAIAQFYKAKEKLKKYLPFYFNLDILALYKNLNNILDCLTVNSYNCNKLKIKNLKKYKEN